VRALDGRTGFGRNRQSALKRACSGEAMKAGKNPKQAVAQTADQ
jgi:hypothetical protein